MALFSRSLRAMIWFYPVFNTSFINLLISSYRQVILLVDTVLVGLSQTQAAWPLRHSFKILCVVQMNNHSPRAASSPRRTKRTIPRQLFI